jgi:alkylation response protein AidB-like acyl-CoA dehydrogenase
VTSPATLRTQLRSWLAANDLERWRGHPATVEETVVQHASLMRLLYDEGFARYGWPAQMGGLGGDERHRAVLYDELSRAQLPLPQQCLSLETLGPAVIRFAPELAAELHPRCLRGEEWWAQGFSEPEAGSDLASLRTRATPDADGYRINGQKIWTSHAVTARRIVMLTRTGTAEERHRGLTMLMVDADAPGITIRPVAMANGRNELAEVFFDDVPVPAARRIGAEGAGWTVAMYLLQWERAMYAWQSACTLFARFERLRSELRGTGSAPADAAARLGDCYLDLVELRARSVETITRLAAGETVGPEASVDKVLLARAEQGLHDAARDLRPASFAIGSAGDGSNQREWRDEWWYSRAASILGGSAEVQRGILADRVLNLPKI